MAWYCLWTRNTKPGATFKELLQGDFGVQDKMVITQKNIKTEHMPTFKSDLQKFEALLNNPERPE